MFVAILCISILCCGHVRPRSTMASAWLASTRAVVTHYLYLAIRLVSAGSTAKLQDNCLYGKLNSCKMLCVIRRWVHDIARKPSRSWLSPLVWKPWFDFCECCVVEGLLKLSVCCWLAVIQAGCLRCVHRSSFTQINRFDTVSSAGSCLFILS